MKANNQLELEEQNLQIVIQKNLAEINKASVAKTFSDIRQTNAIIPYYVGELETRLNVYMHDALLGTAKVKPVPAKALTLLSNMVVSHYTVKIVMNHIGAKGLTAHTMYQSIAKQLETEYNLNLVKQSAPEKHESFIKYLQNTGYNGARLDKITNDLLVKYHADIINRNLRHVFMQVAQLAVYLLSESRPIIGGELAPHLLYVSTIKEGDSSRVVITPADWVVQWIREQTEQGNMIPNYHTALIEPPKPWTGLRSGGFHSERFANNFIKTQVDQSKFKRANLSRTMAAVNTIQNTEWEINTEVLDVMLYAFQNKLNWGELPSPQEIQSTPYPFPELTRDKMNEEQLTIVKAWAAHKAAQHDEFHSEVSRYLSLNRVLNEAKRFSQYDKIYFAYQVDFRGRIYPIAANLHPQGPSFVKPLLRFHRGEVLSTTEAVKFLALQGANTFGKDKLRLDEKYEWVKENESSILASAKNPIDTEFWKTADEPWSFLAFCFEWSGYKADPNNFKSKIPIALDGSCNGLQHLSAMLRDEVGGREVNLTSNYTKKDIYSAVRDIARATLAQMDDPMAKRVLDFGIERSTCKRPVMIMPYAGTQSSCREYVTNDFIERGGKNVFGADLNSAIALTSSVVWSSIGGVVIKGREIMSWFKKSARKAAKMTQDCEINWTTPNGFLVIQRRVRQKETLYQTSMGEKINVRLSIRLLEDTDEIDLSGHASAVSPNFIHSLDACALQETVTKCMLEYGIVDFAMIHDSYGTHAANSAILSQCLRRVFVDMYLNNDVLAQWIASQPKAAVADFPPLPERGQLNLEEVMNSEHFFA